MGKRKKSNHTAISITKIIPSLVTIASLITGSLALKVVLTYNNLSRAIDLLVISAVLDLLDGRLARALKATSKFGGELDALCDFAVFGVFPAFIIYYAGILEANKMSWIAVSFFMISTLVRLARYQSFDINNPKYHNYKHFFMGIPVPAGALLSLLPVYIQMCFNITTNNTIYSIYLTIVSLLMLSVIPTFSTKRIHFKKSVLPLYIGFVALLALFLIYYTVYTLTICAIIYWLSIPITVYFYLRMKKSSNPNLNI